MLYRGGGQSGAGGLRLDPSVRKTGFAAWVGLSLLSRQHGLLLSLVSFSVCAGLLAEGPFGTSHQSILSVGQLRAALLVLLLEAFLRTPGGMLSAVAFPVKFAAVPM